MSTTGKTHEITLFDICGVLGTATIVSTITSCISIDILVINTLKTIALITWVMLISCLTLYLIKRS
jgi:hypothetical protein